MCNHSYLIIEDQKKKVMLMTCVIKTEYHSYLLIFNEYRIQ